MLIDCAILSVKGSAHLLFPDFFEMHKYNEFLTDHNELR
jgi:hypothetical protein